MPNSLLWIGLVVLWLFVLFPMLADRNPRIRRITDTALATRVLHRGGSRRRAKPGPAAGHQSDPAWRPHEDGDWAAQTAEQYRRTKADAARRAQQRMAEAEDDMSSHPHTELAETGVSAYVPEFVPTRRGRGGFDPDADAIASAARYAFRQRLSLGLLLAAIVSGALGLIVTPSLWWVSAIAGTVLVLYLVYLRKQVRLEAEIRRRRMARHSEARQRHRTEVPERLRRPGAVILETDDEDPEFDHLPGQETEAVTPVAEPEFRRASGQ